MYWLRWHCHVKDIAGAPYKIKQNNKQKGQKRQQSVVAGRQQLYCAVQSRSPSNCQMTIGKIQSSARDGTSSVMVHSWQTTAGCSVHVLKPLGSHGHWALNIWWLVLPAWLCQQNADGVECRRKMYGEHLSSELFVYWHLLVVDILSVRRRRFWHAAHAA